MQQQHGRINKFFLLFIFSLISKLIWIWVILSASYKFGCDIFLVWPLLALKSKKRNKMRPTFFFSFLNEWNEMWPAELIPGSRLGKDSAGSTFSTELTTELMAWFPTPFCFTFKGFNIIDRRFRWKLLVSGNPHRKL